MIGQDTATDIIGLYMADVHEKGELLSPEREQELIRAAQAGEENARQKFIEANLRLVIWVANFVVPSHARRGQIYADIIGAGNVGLMRAVEKFDPDRGIKFSTYAVWWIRQAIQRHQIDTRLIRFPVHLDIKVRRIWNECTKVRQQWGDMPLHEISAIVAQRLGMKQEQVEHLYELSQTVAVLSFNQPIRHTDADGKQEIGDLLADADVVDMDEVAHHALLRKRLEAIMEKELSAREERMLRLRLGWDDGNARTFQEIGDKYGFTRENIRRICAEAIDKLKHAMKRDGISYDAIG